MSKKTGIIAMLISVVSLICSLASFANMMQMKAMQAAPAMEAIQEDASVGATLDAVQEDASVAATPDATTESAKKYSEETATQYVMYVGTNDKDTYKPEHTNEEATGSWTDETGTPTHEYTLVCYFDAADEKTVYKAADEIIKELNQNTVLIEKAEIEMDYYSGDK